MGAGVTGIACALALSRELTPFVPDLQITVFEGRDVLSTSGGAINLTPAAQRHLHQLGVLHELDKMGSQGGADIDAIALFSNRSGRRLGSIDFTDDVGNGYGGYRGRRVMRIILSVAMMAVVERTRNVEVVFGKRLVGGEQERGQAVIHFQDGTTAQGDLVLGCDGVHSATRMLWVDPDAPSEYTGISYVQATMGASNVRSPLHFSGTAVNISRHGSLLTSFCDRDCEQLFLAAIVEFDKGLLDYYRPENGQDLVTRIAVRQKLEEEMRQRFGQSGIPCIREMVFQSADWMLYPVYQVRLGGRWFRDRVLLLGDAAHAVCILSPTLPYRKLMKQMPPRDESASYGLDDAILFARILARHRFEPLPDVFRTYQDVRRQTVNDAFKASQWMWEKNRNMGMLEGRLKEWTLRRAIRNQKDAREAAWEFDATRLDLP